MIVLTRLVTLTRRNNLAITTMIIGMTVIIMVIIRIIMIIDDYRYDCDDHAGYWDHES